MSSICACPRLRERPKDIRALAQHFAHKYAEANGVPFARSRAQTERLLLGHHLARQCARAGEHHPSRRAAGAGRGDRARSHPPAGRHAGGRRSPPRSRRSPRAERRGRPPRRSTRSLVGRTVADVERDLILDTLDHCLGNRTHAANILGISIRTLRNKLREYADAGLSIPSHGEQRLGWLEVAS